MTDSVLGASALGWVWMRIVFSLSANRVAVPSLLRAHPSGTDTVNRPVGGVNGTNTWLSGISPAGLFSGVDCAAVPLSATGPGGLLPPHPASAPAVTRIAAAMDTVRVLLFIGSSLNAG